MTRGTEAPIRQAVEQAAAETYRVVREAAYRAALDAAQQAIATATGYTVPVDELSLEDEVTQAEAARRVGVSAPTIDRLRKKGRIWSEKREDGRVYVRLSEVQKAATALPRRTVEVPETPLTQP